MIIEEIPNKNELCQYSYDNLQKAITVSVYGLYKSNVITKAQTEKILSDITSSLTILSSSPKAADNIFMMGSVAKDMLLKEEDSKVTLSKQPYTKEELEAITFYEQQWGMVGERQRDDACELLRLYGMDLYKEGLLIAKKQKKRSFPYIKAICENLSKDIRFEEKTKEEQKVEDGLTDIQRFCGRAWKEVLDRKTNINSKGWSNPIIYQFAKNVDFTKHLGMQQATFMIKLSTYLEQHKEVLGGK